jgi:hypothetical protein
MQKVLNLGKLPGRKRKCLSVTTFHDGGGASVDPLAYFASEDAYEEFCEIARKGIKPLAREEG